MNINLDDYVTEDTPQVQKLLAARQGGNVYGALVSKFSDDRKLLSNEDNDLVHVYEQAIGVYRATAHKLSENLDIFGQRQLQTDSETANQQAVFLNSYALAFAGYVGLSLLEKGKSEVANLYSFGSLANSTKRDEQTEKLGQTLRDDIQRGTTEDTTLDELLQNVFTAWTNQFQWKTYDEVINGQGIDDITFQYGEASMKAGVFKQGFSEVKMDEKFMPIKKASVISPGELGHKIEQGLAKLSAYDHQSQSNVHAPPSTIFTWGAPGCGKTITAHAFLNHHAELCREKGIAFWGLTHSTTDYASHYQNQTANALNELALKIRNFPGHVAMYFPDVDTIFTSRADPNATQEQKQTTAVYFKMFDGSLIPKNGKFMAIMDANYIDKIDDATKSRLFDEMVEVKRWTEPKDFGDLAKIMIGKGTSIDEQGWLSIGEHILATDLSNREIGHALRGVRGAYDVPEDLIGAPIDRHQAIVDEHLASITVDAVTNKIDHQVERMASIEAASTKALLDERYKQWQSDLGSQPGGAHESA